VETTDLRPDVVVHTHGGAARLKRSDDLDGWCVNTIRTLAMDAVQAAGSGHPGAPMGLAPVGNVLWTRFLRFDPTAPGAVARGAFVRSDGDDVVLIGTGSEVSLALAARDILAQDGISARVVSMPSWELFEEQPQTYREQVLPVGTPRLGVEAGRDLGWCRWADDVVSLDRFGASAPGEVVMRELGFTPENVADRAKKMVRQEGSGASGRGR
jgi:transketolase